MEIEIVKRKGIKIKGQMFSLTALLFILLMVVTLLVFVIMSIGYDNLSESSIISSSSTNYGTLLSKSSSTFAYSSGQAALSTLFQYELNPAFREGNFVTNTSEYLQYLIVNGSLPNVPSYSAAAAILYQLMGSATFQSYNSIISSSSIGSSKQITIHETKPQVFQATPYTINIRYTETVAIVAGTGNYFFSIPVNVSIPINSSPDIFYAEQGLFRPMIFSDVKNSAITIGSDYATSGSNQIIYGTVFNVNGNDGPTACNHPFFSGSLPNGYLNAPFSNTVILVATNAFYITGGSGGGSCANNFGGLITGTPPATTPSIPYLVFPASANIISLLRSNQKVLMYGPGLSVLNISNFINPASTGAYFTSPFATSYLDRVSGNFSRQSPNGIFTFFETSREAADLNGLAQLLTSEPQTNILGYTVAAWVYPSQNGLIEGATTASRSLSLGYGSTIIGCGTPANTFFFGDISPGVNLGVNTLTQYPTNTWYFVVGTFNGVNRQAVTPQQFTIYVNGNVVPSGQMCHAAAGHDTAPLTSASTLAISPATSYTTSTFSGSIANMQIYNQTLNQSQVYWLYQEGIEGIPVTTNSFYANSLLLGWYPLNGNSNDYSGYGYPVVPVNVFYSLLSNYRVDSIFVRPTISGNTYPIPGLLTCTTTGQCNAPRSTNVYIGDMPLTIGNGGLSTAYFNNQNSNILIKGFVPTSNVISASVWVDPETPTNQLSVQQDIVQSGNFLLTYNAFKKDEFDYWISIGGELTPVITTSPAMTNQWYMVTGTFGPNMLSNNCLTIYLNGLAVNSICSNQPGYGYLGGPVPLLSYNTQNTIIGSSNVISEYFSGSISNLQIYNSTLSLGQVESLYYQGITAPPIDTYHTVAWYPLDGNANDYSGYGNSGSVITSVGYTFIQSNYSSYYTYNNIGLSTPAVISNEWQTIGFPAHP